MPGWFKGVFVVGLVGAFLVGGVALGLPKLVAPAKPKVTEDRSSNLEGAAQKLKQAERDLRNGRARVTLTEEEISTYLSEKLRETTRSSSVPVTGISVDLSPGRVALELAARPEGKDVGLRISGRPEVRGKDLVIYIEK
ncbi:MAG: hypothetical protein M1598_02580 [Actinobacteria bacterium]|nr:hypothetical protein [Actinomycetota bacterium]